MFVDRVPNRKSPPTYLIRESFREGKKVRKRTLANITKLPIEAIEQIRILLRGGTAVDSVSDAVSIVSNKPHGHVAAVLSVMNQLGLAELIDPRNSRNRRLVMGLIAQRVLDPASKLATSAALDAPTASDTLNEELDLKRVDVDDLYEAMDYLTARKTAIEQRLAERYLKEGSMVLCDITSSYVEGNKNEFAKFGYNRDGKKGKKQIVFGLLTDEDGCPVATEVFAGNTGDPTTVASQVAKLQTTTFGLKQVVLVGDRGLLTQARLREDIIPLGLDWITGMRKSQIRAVVEQKDVQLGLFDEQDLMEVQTDLYPNERVILCKNHYRAQYSATQRDELLEKTEKLLDKVVKATVRKRKPLQKADDIKVRAEIAARRYKMKKHFNLDIKEGHFAYTRNEESIQAEAALDGIYAIRTSLKDEPPADEVVAHYKRLTQVEMAFRTLKSVSLQVRPIHHRRKHRVIAHVFLCMLAYLVEYHLRKQLAPMLFADDCPEGKAARRTSVVQSSRRSHKAQQKARTKRTADGGKAMSYASLMKHLSGVCRAIMVPKLATGTPPRIPMRAPFTSTQKRAFKLLKVKGL